MFWRLDAEEPVVLPGKQRIGSPRGLKSLFSPRGLSNQDGTRIQELRALKRRDAILLLGVRDPTFLLHVTVFSPSPSSSPSTMAAHFVENLVPEREKSERSRPLLEVLGGITFT